MSSELDEVAQALFNGHIPAIWRKLAPDTLKSLGNWMIHFNRRYKQYSSWVRTGPHSHRHYIGIYSILELHMDFQMVCLIVDISCCVLCVYQVDEGEPNVMWLSGLHIPESYLTALVQATCRKNGWPLDRSTLYTEVTQYRNEDEVNERPGQGNNFLTICSISVDIYFNCTIIALRYGG